ncbi:ArnT family glycosyltransferase [Maricaulaceae bacterium MS644]
MSPLDSWFTPFRAALAAAFLALAAGLAGVFTLPVIDRDEARYAQATAQMLESGNYVEIRFLDTARNKKPAGIHWLQAASVAAVSSEAAREIWAYRLPSVLGAMLAAAFTALAGARLYSSGAGLAAGGLLGVSVLLGVEAGIAKTDAMLTATVGLAFLAFIALRQSAEIADPARRRNSARLWAVIWWAALGAGALVKGPVAPLCAGLAVVVLCALERRIKWALPLAFWPGPLLAVLLALPWLIAVQIATGGGFLAEALGGDLGPKLVSGDEGHGGAPGLHLVLLPLLFFPGIALLPAGLRAAVKDWRASSLPIARSAGLAAKLIACFALPTWILFEILPTKLPHYVLPAYPALAVLAGLGFERLRETARVWIVVGTGLLVLSAFIYAAAMRYVAVNFGGPEALAYIFGAVLIVAAAAGAVMVWRRRALAALAGLLMTGLIWHVAARGVVAPGAQDLFLSAPAAGAVAALQRGGAPAPLISSYSEPSFAFLTGGDLTLSSPEEIVALAPDPSAAAIYVLDVARWYEGSESLGDEEVRAAQFQTLVNAACAFETVDGINYSRGAETTLIVILTGCPRETQTEGDAP